MQRAARHLQDDDYEARLLSDDFLSNPKVVEEQVYIWQQLQYQQQADTIQRKRQEQRSRHDSSGDPLTFAPSSSPGTASGIPRPSPQTTQPSASFASTSSDRNSVPSSWGPTTPNWSTSSKPALLHQRLHQLIRERLMALTLQNLRPLFLRKESHAPDPSMLAHFLMVPLLKNGSVGTTNSRTTSKNAFVASRKLALAHWEVTGWGRPRSCWSRSLP